jgi:hypothetical protein
LRPSGFTLAPRGKKRGMLEGRKVPYGFSRTPELFNPPGACPARRHWRVVTQKRYSATLERAVAAHAAVGRT